MVYCVFMFGIRGLDRLEESLWIAAGVGFHILLHVESLAANLLKHIDKMNQIAGLCQNVATRNQSTSAVQFLSVWDAQSYEPVKRRLRDHGE
jgi:hypothetical protein